MQHSLAAALIYATSGTDDQYSGPAALPANYPHPLDKLDQTRRSHDTVQGSMRLRSIDRSFGLFGSTDLFGMLDSDRPHSLLPLYLDGTAAYCTTTAIL
jgi:hypothetical protein